MSSFGATLFDSIITDENDDNNDIYDGDNRMKSLGNHIKKMIRNWNIPDNMEILSEETFFEHQHRQQYRQQQQQQQQPMEALYRLIRMDISEQNVKHSKNDNEANRFLQMGLYFFRNRRYVDLNLAINCFSRAILTANNTRLVFESYYHRALAFLSKKLFYYSFFDSNYYLENVIEDSDNKRTISECYIESCVEIIDSNLNKASCFGRSDYRIQRWMRIASEFLDRARIELAIQMLQQTATPTTTTTTTTTATKPKPSDRLIQWMRKLDTFEFKIDLTPAMAAKKFQFFPYKHSNIEQVVDLNQNCYKDNQVQPRGHDILYEKPLSALTTKPLRYCGWCSNWIGYKFIPCTRCDQTIYCNNYCRRLDEEFGGHFKICCYHYRVAELLGVECYMIYAEAAKTKKIIIPSSSSSSPLPTPLSLSMGLNTPNNDDDQLQPFKIAVDNENQIRFRAIILSYIIQQKIFRGTLQPNVHYYREILTDLRNRYRSPFLAKRISEKFIIDNDGTLIVQKRSDIYGNGVIEYLIECCTNNTTGTATNQTTTIPFLESLPMNTDKDLQQQQQKIGNIGRYFKSGKIVYKALVDFDQRIQFYPRLILQL
ncbi:uncharacterized protein LOC113789384 [Dermatophagoides pteronyssinus]|uniref:uncharacterized protein LOC113789384 n=1 Tax=Dermatophagoides pteronyssinus TaxID=6956 RepID=UPI003F6754F2